MEEPKSLASPTTTDTTAPGRSASDVSFVPVAPKWYLVWVAAAITLAAGICCVFSAKLQNRALVPVCGEEKCKSEYFDQPYWQAFLMFCGEALCLGVYWADKWRAKRNNQRVMTFEFPNSLSSFNKPRSPIWWWSIPALLDMVGSTIVNVAFTMSYASTIQMLRNSILLFTSFFSVVMIRRPLRVHQASGIVIMTVSMIVAGIQAIRNPEEATNKSDDLAWLGVVLAIIGTLFSALQLIVEEWFFKRSYMPPLKCMGIEGLFGIVFSLISILVAHYAGGANISHGWYQMNHSGAVLAGNLWFLASTWVFNASSICTTKLGSGLLRSVVYSMRAPLVWLIELIISWQDYAWEQLLALILAFVGFVIYAFVLPGISKKSTPIIYKSLKAQIPCFCTHPEPDSDEEDMELQQKDEDDQGPMHAYKAEAPSALQGDEQN